MIVRCCSQKIDDSETVLILIIIYYVFFAIGKNKEGAMGWFRMLRVTLVCSGSRVTLTCSNSMTGP